MQGYDVAMSSNWFPVLANDGGTLHERLLAALRRDMGAGRLAPGERLPTHRELARALGIGVGDRVAIMEHAYYSVISPEGCAGILWKSHTHKEKAAKALKLTSRDLHRLGVVDDVIEEPLGGAHRDHNQTAARLKMYLQKSFRELKSLSTEQLLAARYEKFRKMGVFTEGATA